MKRHTIAFILGGASLAVALFAMLGYALESAWMTNWGFGDGSIRMSVPTAVAIILVSLAVMLASHEARTC